jgi:cytoskeletal protein CcmA (bactofilin family)
MITNPIYRLPTTKSIQTLTNDGYYNINIASTPSGTFPNFRTTARGPNLISIGNGNYKLVAGALRDSIAIGNTILNANNPTGYGIIGMGQNVFPQLTTGFQNIGIGNAIATSMITGHNNVFIGNSVATSTTSTGNTVAIGTNAGFTNATGINNTYLGAFTGANAVAYSNSTAIGYGATITASNQIKLGTANETTNIDGNLIVNKTIQTTNLTVSGTTSLISDITLPGNLIVNNTTPSYNVNSGSFQLKGGAGILGNVFINQNLSVAQVSTFSGNVSLNGIQNTFTGDVSMNGNLHVNKTSIFNGNVLINGNITFAKDVSMNANAYVAGTLMAAHIDQTGGLEW